MATTKRRMRDFQRCLRTIQSFTDSQASITEWDDTGLEWFSVQLRPKEGYYSGGQFDFKVIFEGSYPKSPPRVDCLTQVYHPNIDTTSTEYNVCLNLFDEWTSTNNLEDVVQGLLFLMYNPNLEDPLSPYFDPNTEENEFKDSVQLSLQGLQVESLTPETFPKNQSAGHFDENELNADMQQILEETSCLEVLEDEDDADSDDEDEDEAQNASATDNSATAMTEEEQTENAVNSVARSAEELALPILRQESKVDKLDADIPKVEEDKSDDLGTEYRDKMSMYIPRTFIPPQPDFLVSVFMTCVRLATR